MDERVVSSSERQQLVGPEEEGGAGPGALSLSHSLSPALSCGGQRAVQPSHHGGTRVAYVSERRARERRAPPARPTLGEGRGEARRTQAALLRLLAAFRAPPPPSEPALHLAHIRQQQDDLARLHFKLGSEPDSPARPASARETMARLVHSLEQLSTSIEQLHLTTAGRPEPDEDSDDIT